MCTRRLEVGMRLSHNPKMDRAMKNSGRKSEKPFINLDVSYNVFWNKDYSIEAAWLGGKPVGGVDVAVKLPFGLGGVSVLGREDAEGAD